MRILLDTHIFLWAVTADQRLPRELVPALMDGSNEVYVSAASIWESAIKSALGRLPVVDVRRLVDAVEGSGFRHLPVDADHAAATSALEPLHRDPFDRLLLAQAAEEQMTLATVDDAVRRYGDVTFVP